MKHPLFLLLIAASCVTTPLADVQFIPPLLIVGDCLTVEIINSGGQTAYNIVAEITIYINDETQLHYIAMGDLRPGERQKKEYIIPGLSFEDDTIHRVQGSLTWD